MTTQFTAQMLKTRFALDFDLNEDQVSAINLSVEWFRGWQDRRHRRQVFFLNGFAGTGKTTVAKIITSLCCGMDRTVFIAPTGKAASRLRQKGCPGARTMHQFIYNVRGNDEDGQPIFVAKGALDEKPLLVCLDEASMVGEYDMGKILEHRIPVLALGDTGQIPPVKAAVYFKLENADVTLETIERNAGNIVRASMFVRMGKRLPEREYDDVLVTAAAANADHFKQYLTDDGVILCSYNNTRAEYNAKARKLLGFNGVLPGAGEKVVCTFNQHGYGIMNGEQGVIIGFSPVPDGDEDDSEPDDMLIMEYRSLTDGAVRMAKFNPSCFMAETKEERDTHMKCIGGFDYGYCLTIHKSQGSEWKFVYLIEEILRGVPYNQLMYTGITRAIQYLRIKRAN